ncbi:Uncharacterized protein APZ42_018694 [Daphnia magna]|uniref:Uncharacterized protein n=1 Tax=Daphnia magna TaxID=35525 RepID=A0A164YR86_9CRUS|nr:Uncharacterized protein APZ42_018694 [Daphnia magna]
MDCTSMPSGVIVIDICQNLMLAVFLTMDRFTVFVKFLIFKDSCKTELHTTCLLMNDVDRPHIFLRFLPIDGVIFPKNHEN